MPWQVHFLSRLFGWVGYSEQYKRDVRRFRRASLWVPKKNGKSPLAAMVGLYLLVGDGEQGQKVFSCAKDGKQAGIMHKHAMMMVEQSPSLAEECKLNQTTQTITHVSTNSEYRLVAGDNKESQEGLNGSVIIDETHVMDERLAKILRYAGASRSEPIWLEVSTAGTNPEGYGRKQYDYGKAVQAGTITDHRFLFQCYEAPADVSDDEAGNPRLHAAANPSMGVTISAEEMMQEYEAAKRSPSDMATFKLYRLNVWQTSESPWLRESDWRACRDNYTADDLAGQECWAGLDLAKTRDTTSLQLLFRHGDGYRLLSYFWLPEATAKESAHMGASYFNWKSSGHLFLTPGEVCDYSFVFKTISELSKKFKIQELAYDPYNAEDLTQKIENELGVTRIEFRQVIQNFAGPTAEFERLVIQGEMKHNGHPLMSWQIGNAQVSKPDVNANKRPVKAKPDDHRKIDGVVAAVMALARAELARNTKSSVYKSRGLVTI